MKVLITGAGGFIGGHLVKKCLEAGWFVVGVGKNKADFEHKNFLFIQKHVEDLDSRDLEGVDYVFHLAFATNILNTVESPLETTRTNIDGTVYLLGLCAKAGVKKFVFASTASIYGYNPIPWREDTPPDPIEPYSWQKLSCEFACKMWSKRYNLPTVNLRLFQVFGENQRHDTVLALFAGAKKEGRPITLTKTSRGGSCSRDFVYAGDVAEAFIKAALSNESGAGEVINIASGRQTYLEDIAKIFGGEISWIPIRNYEVEDHQADIAKAKDLLSWQTSVDVLRWLKNNITKI